MRGFAKFVGTQFLLVDLLKAVMTCRYGKTSFFFKRDDEIVRERGFFFKRDDEIVREMSFFFKRDDAFVCFVHLRR